MDRRPTWTNCDEAGDYIVPNVLSPRDLVFRPDNMDETVPHTIQRSPSVIQETLIMGKYTCTTYLIVPFCCHLAKFILVN